MGDLSNKLEDGLAKFEAIDAELDAALKELGLPGRQTDPALAGDIRSIPEIMRICAILPLDARYAELRAALNAGADPNERCQWGAMALDTLYTDGDADGIAILLEYGADATDYGWQDSHLAVIRNDPTHLALGANDCTDYIGDTPYFLACRFGRMKVLESLDQPACFHEPLMVAARANRMDVMCWLLAQGADVNTTGPDGATPLMPAVEAGEAAMVALLLEQGASLDVTVDLSFSRDVGDADANKLQLVLDKMMSAIGDTLPDQIGPQQSTVYDAAYDPAIVRLLVEHGADPAKFDEDMLPVAIGVDRLEPIHISRHMFAAQYPVRQGRANPEQVDVPFWKEQIRTGASGYEAKERFVGKKVETSAPVWSFARFGRSATRLDDGRFVLIGGEHEDHYDPDFCIYNDVTVVGNEGEITQYIYPNAAFPPTAFHTATLVDDGIWLIGNLGYEKQRVDGQTQVMWLSLMDFSMHKVATSGQAPGWIHRHTATLLDKTIHISGGKVEPGHGDLKGSFMLDLETRVWHAVN